MTPNELRALADALRPMAKAPCFDGIDIERAADYLRAQADAQPVAWIAHNLTTGRVKWTTDRCRARGWRQDADLRVKLLYADPAPAAPQAEPADRCRSSETPDPKATGRSSPERPASNREDAAATVAAGSGEQAEPCIGNDPTCPCQDGDACHYRDAADGTKGWPVPQAEPKREPSLGELMREQRQSRIVAGAYPDGNPNAGAMMAQTRQAEPKREDQPVRDLLAIIHCDGGHHTEAVGLDQSIKDAQAAVCELKRELAMGKREPLSDDEISKLGRQQ